MKIYIKNMVCCRCKMMVKSELEKLGLHSFSIELGEVELQEDISEVQKQILSKKLQSTGFELIDDKKGNLLKG